MSMKRRIALAGTAAVAGLTLAACGSGGSEAAKTKSATQVPVAATAPATPPAPVQSTPVQNPPAAQNWKGRLVLSTAQNATLGTTVIDAKGFTVYRFDKVPAPAGGTSSGDQGYSSY